MMKSKVRNISIILILLFLTACGSPPLIRPEGQTTPEQETAAETVTLAATQEAVEAKSTSPLPTPMVIPVATATEPLAVATPVSPVATPIATEPPGGGYSADKISLVPGKLNLEVKALSTKSTEPKIGFISWSNSSKKFAFGIPLSAIITDPTLPDGNNTYTVSELWIANFDGTNAQQITDQSGGRVIWSPDDTWLVYSKLVGVSKIEFWIIDLNTNAQAKLDEPAGIGINNNDYYGSIAWLDNYRLIYSTYSKTEGRRLWLYDVKTEQNVAIKVDDKLDNRWSSFWLAPNKKFMVGDTVEPLHELWLGQLIEENGQFRLNYVKTLVTEGSLTPFWSPDSIKLALLSFGIMEDTLRVLDVNSGELVTIPLGIQVAEVNWSPDSRVMIVNTFPSGNSPTNPIYMVNSNGSNLRSLGDFTYRTIHWSPDGQHLVLQGSVLEATSDITFDSFKVEVKQ